MPQFYCVIGNRDHLKIQQGDAVEKLPIWHFIEGNHRHWLTSLVYLKGMQVPDGHHFLDCGAWSYKNEADPRWTPEECVVKYSDVANPGDLVAAPDHMVLRDHNVDEQTRRIGITLSNAREFLSLCPPEYIATGVTHGNDIDTRVRMTEHLLELGYTSIAIGSVAMKAGNRKFLHALLDATVRLREQHPFRLHVLGVSALSWFHDFRQYGVDSYDGSAMFYAAFTGASYYWVNDEGQIAKYSVKGLPTWALPECDCLVCVVMRDQGIETRQMGSNEHNMGRAVHNINMYLRAMRMIQQQKPTRQQRMDFT